MVSTMGIRIGVAAVTIAAVALTAGAHAASISYSGSFSDVYTLPSSGGVSVFGPAPVIASSLLNGIPQGVVLPKFDPGLGALTGASVQMHETADDVTIYLDLTGYAGSSSSTAHVSGSSSSQVGIHYSIPVLGWSTSVTSPTDGTGGSGSGPDDGSGFSFTLSYQQRGIDLSVTHSATTAELPSFVGAASFFVVMFQLSLDYDVYCNSVSSDYCRVATYLIERPAWTGEATVTYLYDPAVVRVAEPAALPLLGFGLIGLAALRRRRD